MKELHKILLIEDNPDQRLIISRQLSAHRLQVVEADGGESGVALAAKEKPDVILLDIMMPGQDGIKTYQVLKQNPVTQAIPVIFLTALAPDKSFTKYSLELLAFTKHGYRIDGKFAVIGKTGSPEDLLRDVRNAWNEIA